MNTFLAAAWTFPVATASLSFDVGSYESYTDIHNNSVDVERYGNWKTDKKWLIKHLVTERPD